MYKSVTCCHCIKGMYGGSVHRPLTYMGRVVEMVSSDMGLVSDRAALGCGAPRPVVFKIKKDQHFVLSVLLVYVVSSSSLCYM